MWIFVEFNDAHVRGDVFGLICLPEKIQMVMLQKIGRDIPTPSLPVERSHPKLADANTGPRLRKHKLTNLCEAFVYRPLG